MLKFILKSLGLIEIMLSFIGALSIVALFRTAYGTIVVPELAFYIIIYILLLLSGIGLLLRNRTLFFCTFYAWTLICLKIIDRAYTILIATTVGNNADALVRISHKVSAIALLIVAGIVSLQLFLSRNSVLKQFNIGKGTTTAIHVFAACLFYIIYTATFN